MDLFRVCQFWFVIGSVRDGWCFRTISVSFETVFSYEGSWGWCMGGTLLEGRGIIGGIGNGISVEVWVFCFWWCQAAG